MTYRVTIGLEIHAELKTATKMFCSSKNDAGERRPNVNICPVCLAHPGTLPVINKEAVHHVLRVGAAVGGTPADYTEFDRKNYFYPDLPKGYQISQYEFPLISGGMLNGVKLTRIHLEEDTASSVHVGKEGENAATNIDFNRSGVPLMELVTEPVIHSADEAVAFAQELRLLLRYLDASDADMEQGQMRLEANISISKTDTLGTKVEVKNINSFRSMERAIKYELKRQEECLEKGEVVVQETRGWDDTKQRTFPQRVKEVAADYRYFPDPDLPSLRLSEISAFGPESVAKGLPEIPDVRRARYKEMGIKEADAVQFVAYPKLGDFLDSVLRGREGDGEYVKRTVNYIANDIAGIIRDNESRDTEIKEEIPISATYFISLMTLLGEGKITSRVAKDLIPMIISEKRDPKDIANERGLFSNTEIDLTGTVASIVSAHPNVVSDYKNGKEAALQFLVGQGMRALKGAVDPATLRSELLRQIG